MNELEWIAVDWGTSNLRAFAMSSSDQILDRAQSERGMASLNSPDEFESALVSLIDSWLPKSGGQISVISCGMVGAKQGWIEAPYQPVPCSPSTEKMTEAPVNDERFRFLICPGVKQSSPKSDVMRGEETQIAGLLRHSPGFSGLICLPGTHSKWVKLENGEIVEFQTFLTGELFELLSTKSVLRFSIGDLSGDSDSDVFLRAVSEAISDPASISATLFSIRADDLLQKSGAASARSRLSGLLIGWELAAAQKWWAGDEPEIAIIGSSRVGKAYRKTLSVMGAQPELMDIEFMTLGGLCSAYRGLSA